MSLFGFLSHTNHIPHTSPLLECRRNCLGSKAKIPSCFGDSTGEQVSQSCAESVIRSVGHIRPALPPPLASRGVETHRCLSAPQPASQSTQQHTAISHLGEEQGQQTIGTYSIFVKKGRWRSQNSCRDCFREGEIILRLIPTHTQLSTLKP